MNRIFFRKYFIISVITGFVFFICIAVIHSGSDARESKNGKGNAALQRPSWLGNEPLIIVGNWDSMPIFRRRVGGNPVWQEEEYEKEHTEEAVRKLKEMGVTMAVIHFYKGFGLQAEREHMAYARKLTALCKKYGIRVGVYIGSTLAYETFLPEKPEAREWIVDNYLGQPIRYGGTQTFRKRVYFMHPGYVEYMKNVVRIAVEEFGVDLIHFDNTSMRAQAPIFFHPMAIQDFRNFLNEKYTADELKIRLGFSDVSYVEPPPYNRPLSTIDDPLFQEWADFRCRQLADFYGDMERYIRSMNPEVAVENNPHSGMSGNNTIWEQGVDYPRLLAHTDIVWTEEGNEAGVSEDGILISKIRTYKMAQTLKNRIFTYTSDSRLQMAEAMAYNRQCMGMVGGALAGYQLPEDRKSYIRFYHDNFGFYRDIETVADVAVLHSFATMAYNNDRPYQSTFLIEQALIQEKIPFDIIFDDNLNELSRYRALVLADQECLSELQISLIREFVRKGGGLIATEHTSLYTERRQRKQDFGLKDLFGVSAGEEILPVSPVKNGFGNGRVVYIPEVIPAIEKPRAEAMRSRYWKLPENRRQIIESVEWASGETLSVTLKAPLYVAAEITRKTDGSALLVHLLNYDVDGNPEIRDIPVSLLIPSGRRIKSVTVLSPDRGESKEIDFSVQNGTMEFTVPFLYTYTLAAAAME